MIVRPASRIRIRRGATVVEVAVVISVVILFLFSIFEYGRFVMMENVLINGVREGCRYALVHSQDVTVVSDVQAVVRQRMGGLDSQLPDLDVQVFPTDNPGAALSTLNPDDPITVRATGTFKTMFPTLLFMPVTLTLRSSSVMTCEGN